MTPVEFTFVTPDGLPVVDADVSIQLLKSGYDPVETGVIMPREVIVNTGPDGKVTVILQPSKIAYQVTVYDTASDAALSYKFYVPLLTPPNTKVRFQDIIVDALMSDKTYDEEALILIANVKADVITAEINVQGMQVDITGKLALINAAEETVHGYVNEASNLLDSTIVKANQAAQSALDSSGFATASATSAGNSAASATTSSTKAGEAAASATSAATQAGNAATSATASATSATASDTARGLAVTAKTAAETARDAASGFATAASTSAGNAATSATNANTSAGNAAGSATAAATSKTNADTAAVLAQDWATKLGTAVSGGLYSAKYYAQQASAASAAATSGQIQANWNETDSTAKAYIWNKPVYSVVAVSGSYTDLVNKPTLSTVAGTGSYNDLLNKPAIPTVPTVVSAFTNDAQYTTLAAARAGISVAGGALTYNNATGVITYTAPVLATVATTGSYADLTNKPVIPANVSQLTNDSGYLTTNTVPVRSVAGKTGFVTLIKSDVGLDLVDNTSDANKPISIAVQAALDLKLDAIKAVNLAMIHTSRLYF